MNQKTEQIIREFLSLPEKDIQKLIFIKLKDYLDSTEEGYIEAVATSKSDENYKKIIIKYE